MAWLDEIPATVEDGYLTLIPENSETKTVKDVAPAFERSVNNMIANGFSEVLD